MQNLQKCLEILNTKKAKSYRDRHKDGQETNKYKA